MMTPINTWNKKYQDLSSKAKRITSENETDGLIKAVFEIIQPQNNWCVEVGAFDGYHTSNTYSLIENGWKSLQIEGLNDLLLTDRYKDNSNVICAKTFIVPDHTGGVNDFSVVLEKYEVPKNFDFLSLDIDGQEYEVWKAMRYQPNLMLVECNSMEEDFNVINYDPSYSVISLEFTGYNPIRYGGATVGLLNRLGDYKGYDLLCVDNSDALYIRREFGEKLLVK